MSSLDALEFGAAGGNRFARNTGRSVTGDSVGSMRYPSPFFDIASTYLPTSFKSMLRWCRYYFLTNAVINAVSYKMAEYPITDWVFDTDNAPLRAKWEYLLHSVLQYKKFEVEAGLDYEVYGNAFISIFFPFKKMLRCKKCRKAYPVDKVDYVFRDYKFAGTCKSCNEFGEFTVQDQYIRSVRDIRLIRWNPEYITIQHNEATGENRYYYTIPPTLANDIRMGKRNVIERIPQSFLEALRQNKALLFSRDNLYHMKRPTIAQKDHGWGMPMILPVLKDAFYLQILRKAQEAISLEHIVPLRILFPQSGGSAGSDPYATLNLTHWQTKIEQEIMRWRLDNNYIPILPLPVGSETLGGDGRALMLAQEYRVWTEQIISGMGVPVEFFFGGMSFSGSNVSLRILENHFLDMRSQRKQCLVSFVMPAVAAFMGWQTVPVHSKRFKMADDLQRSAYYLQLNQAGKISDKSLLEDTDWDYLRESEQISLENKSVMEKQREQALAQANIQGESQLVMTKYQARAQRVMAELAPQVAGQGMEVPGSNPMAGNPQMSPEAMGEMNNAQVGAMNQAGQFPPSEVPPVGAGDEQGGIPGVGSQLNAEQQGGGVDIGTVAGQLAARLDQLPDNQKQHELAQIRKSSPQLYSLVLPMLQQRAGAEMSSAQMTQPAQKPPRRGTEAVTQ